MSDTQTKEQQSSTQKNPKKQLSYTYWVDEKNKSRELPPQQRPKKVEVPQSLKKQQSGRSDWNNSGTWEQRTVSVLEIQKQVEQALKSWLEIENNPKTLKEVSIQGEFEYIFSRNKKSLMYELSGKVQFESEKNCQLKLLELNDQGQRDHCINADINQQKEWLNKHSESILKVIDEVIQKYKQ